MYTHTYVQYMYIYTHIERCGMKGEVLLRGGSARCDICGSSVKALLVKCPSVQWQPDGLTIHTKKRFLGAGFLGAPPISLIRTTGLVQGLGGPVLLLLPLLIGIVLLLLIPFLLLLLLPLPLPLPPQSPLPSPLLITAPACARFPGAQPGKTEVFRCSAEMCAQRRALRSQLLVRPVSALRFWILEGLTQAESSS